MEGQTMTSTTARDTSITYSTAGTLVVADSSVHEVPVAGGATVGAAAGGNAAVASGDAVFSSDAVFGYGASAVEAAEIAAEIASDDSASIAADDAAASEAASRAEQSDSAGQVPKARPLTRRPIRPQICNSYKPKERHMPGLFSWMGSALMTYSSKFLEMATPQDHRSKEHSARVTFAWKKRYENMCKIKNTKVQTNLLILETCLLNHWLVQHSVLALYEMEDPKRKENAVKSFPNDVAGQWQYSDGDVLLIPRKNPNTPDHYLKALKDIENGLRTIHSLPDSYKIRMVTIPREEIDFSRFTLHIGMTPRNKLTIYRLFKPIFTKCYFKFEDPFVTRFAIILALEMLQKACLVLIPLCDYAIHCVSFGSALLLAQTLFLCTRYMDILLQSDVLLELQVYTHVMARWYLAQCYYYIWRLCSHSPKTYMEYDRTKADMKGFLEALDGFHEEFQEQVTELRLSNWLMYHDPYQASKLALEMYAAIEMPPTWYRSAMRQLELTIAHLTHRLQQCIIEMSHVNTGDSTLSDIQSDILSQLQHNKDEQHHAALMMVALHLAAVCCRYRALIKAAWQLDTSSTRGSRGPHFPPNNAEKDLYNQMSDSQLRALSLILNHEDPSSSIIMLIKQCQMSFLAHQIFLQIELEEREENYRNGLSCLMLALQLSVPMWVKFDLLSGAATDRTGQLELEPIDQQLAVFCAGVSIIYKIKVDKDSNEEQRAIWLNNARYYHGLSTQCARQRPDVAKDLLQFYVELATPVFEVFSPDNDDHLTLSVQQQLQRCLWVLQRFVYAQPMLWELSLADDSQHISLHHHPIRITKAELPFPSDEIKHLVAPKRLETFQNLEKRLQSRKKLFHPRLDESTETLAMVAISQRIITENYERIAVLTLSKDGLEFGASSECVCDAVQNIMSAIFGIVNLRRGKYLIHKNWMDNSSHIAVELVQTFMTKLYRGEGEMEELPQFGVVATAFTCICTIVALNETKLMDVTSSQQLCAALEMRVGEALSNSASDDQKTQAGSRYCIANVRDLLANLCKSRRPNGSLSVIQRLIDLNEQENIEESFCELTKATFVGIIDSFFTRYNEYTLLQIAHYTVEGLRYSPCITGLTLVYSSHAEALKFQLPTTDQSNPIGGYLKKKISELTVVSAFQRVVEPRHQFVPPSREPARGPFRHVEQFHQRDELNTNRNGNMEYRRFMPDLYKCSDMSMLDLLNHFRLLIQKALHALIQALKDLEYEHEDVANWLPAPLMRGSLEDNLRSVQTVLVGSHEVTTGMLAVTLTRVDRLLFQGTTLRVLTGRLPEAVVPGQGSHYEVMNRF